MKWPGAHDKDDDFASCARAAAQGDWAKVLELAPMCNKIW